MSTPFSIGGQLRGASENRSGGGSSGQVRKGDEIGRRVEATERHRLVLKRGRCLGYRRPKR